MRSKPFVSANFDNYSLPGDGDFDNFFLENVKIPTLCPTPPPSGLTLIGALLTLSVYSALILPIDKAVLHMDNKSAVI